jgi:hypothetical protein
VILSINNRLASAFPRSLFLDALPLRNSPRLNECIAMLRQQPKLLLHRTKTIQCAFASELAAVWARGGAFFTYLSNQRSIS